MRFPLLNSKTALASIITAVVFILALSSWTYHYHVSKQTEVPVAPVAVGFTRNDSVPLVCFLTRTYSNQYSYLLTHLLAISQNPQAKPVVLIAITDETSSRTEAAEIALLANEIVGYKLTEILPSPVLPMMKENLGYDYADAAIDLIVSNRSTYPCDLLIVTNGDNLYTSLLVDEYLVPDLEEGVELIGWNFISHYGKHDLAVDGNSHDDGSKHLLHVEFARARIDLAAYAVKVDLLSADPEMRFLKQSKARGSLVQESDGAFAEYVSEKTDKKRIHRQTLLIHQK